MYDLSLYLKTELALADSAVQVSTLLNLYSAFLTSSNEGESSDELEWVNKELSSQCVGPGVTPSYRIISAYNVADVLLVGSRRWQKQKIDYRELSGGFDLCANGQYYVGESVFVLEDMLRASPSELILHKYEDFSVPCWSRVGAGQYQNVCCVCNKSEIINLLCAIRDHVRVAFGQFPKPTQKERKSMSTSDVTVNINGAGTTAAIGNTNCTVNQSTATGFAAKATVSRDDSHSRVELEKGPLSLLRDWRILIMLAVVLIVFLFLFFKSDGKSKLGPHGLQHETPQSDQVRDTQGVSK